MRLIANVLSLAYGCNSVAIHFTWRADEPAVRSVLCAVERALGPFGARLHWSKVFKRWPDELETLLPRLSNVRRMAHFLDPQGAREVPQPIPEPPDLWTVPIGVFMPSRDFLGCGAKAGRYLLPWLKQRLPKTSKSEDTGFDNVS